MWDPLLYESDEPHELIFVTVCAAGSTSCGALYTSLGGTAGGTRLRYTGRGRSRLSMKSSVLLFQDAVSTSARELRLSEMT